MSIAYYNGNFFAIDEVRIPLSDRAIFFGDGIYDAAMGKNGKIYMECEHVERFTSNARALGLPLALSENKLRDLLETCIRRAGEDCFFIYFQLTRNMAERRHAYTGNESNLLITVTPINEPNPDRRISLSLFDDKRYGYCNIKTLNLLPSVLASTDAVSRGFDEAIFVRDGRITECAHSNLSIVKDGELFTHPDSNLILPGTARKKMMEIALDLGAVCHDTAFSEEDLFSADEVLVTSSTKLCIRADRIEDRKFETKSGSLGDKICKKMYLDFVNSTK